MNIVDLEPLIAIDVNECPDAIVSNALIRSLRKFYRLTQLWRHTESITPVAGDSTVTLTSVPAGAEICGIAEADLEIYLTKEIFRIDPTWRTRTDTKASALVYDDPTIYLYPAVTANASTAISITVALIPTVTATTVPDNTILWDTVIAAGALAWLKGMNDKPWTDRQAVAALEQQFEDGWNAAIVNRNTSTGRPKPIRTTQYGY